MVNSFATQSFTFSAPEIEGLCVSKITFGSTLVGSSKAKIMALVFSKDGTCNVGNGTVSVSAVAVEFNVVLSSWSWCGGAVSCKGSLGKGAQWIWIWVSSGQGQPKTASKSGAFDLGGGNELLMLNTYSTDGGNSWTEMPTGYPKVDGSKFTLKFPRWVGSATVVHDPVVTSIGPPTTSRCIFANSSCE